MNYVDYPFESPTVLSFCPGILGLERGIERAIGKIDNDLLRAFGNSVVEQTAELAFITLLQKHFNDHV